MIVRCEEMKKGRGRGKLGTTEQACKSVRRMPSCQGKLRTRTTKLMSLQGTSRLAGEGKQLLRESKAHPLQQNRIRANTAKKKAELQHKLKRKKKLQCIRSDQISALDRLVRRWAGPTADDASLNLALHK